MTWKLGSRLALAGITSALLLVALAYYWLDNATHEVVGTAMFALLVLHNTLHRRWFGTVARRQDRPRTLDKVLVLALLVAIAAVAMPDAFTARRVHAVAAYWVLVLAALHIGIRWRLVLGWARNAVRALWLRAMPWRLLAWAAAAAGIASSFTLGIGGKLAARLSLDGWDFSSATPAFFAHHLAVVALYATVAHVVFRRMQGPAIPNPQETP